ncbi:uncharacterized protein V1518DRAFT_423033 [Limtongia smithiae]|uniref:uncharacterized protein n=1 Tax=Limtongia smithiae TaxID=1125753 RepID=UPI0034CDCDB0
MTTLTDEDDDLFTDLYGDTETSAAPISDTIYGPVFAAKPSSRPTTLEYEEPESPIPSDDDDPTTRATITTTGSGGGAAREPESSKEDGKMFIGGLNWDTTDEALLKYFSQFGEVSDCQVMREPATGRSRGFGFLTFKDSKCVNTVMVKEHVLDGKIIDPKRAIPKDEQEKTSKIFVGGLAPSVTDSDFHKFFSQFGKILDASLMMDKETGRSRGFGFITFESDSGVDNTVANSPLTINGKMVEVKKAQPRGKERGEDLEKERFDEADAKDEPGTGAYNSNTYYQNGMSPSMWAKYWFRLQQYLGALQSLSVAAAGVMPVAPSAPTGFVPTAPTAMATIPTAPAAMTAAQTAPVGAPTGPGSAGYAQQLPRAYETMNAVTANPSMLASAGSVVASHYDDDAYEPPDVTAKQTAPPTAPTGPAEIRAEPRALHRENTPHADADPALTNAPTEPRRHHTPIHDTDARRTHSPVPPAMPARQQQQAHGLPPTVPSGPRALRQQFQSPSGKIPSGPRHAGGAQPPPPPPPPPQTAPPTGPRGGDRGDRGAGGGSGRGYPGRSERGGYRGRAGYRGAANSYHPYSR